MLTFLLYYPKIMNFSSKKLNDVSTPIVFLTPYLPSNLSTVMIWILETCSIDSSEYQTFQFILDFLDSLQFPSRIWMPFGYWTKGCPISEQKSVFWTPFKIWTIHQQDYFYPFEYSGGTYRHRTCSVFKWSERGWTPNGS